MAAPPQTHARLRSVALLALCACAIYSFVRTHLLRSEQFLFLNSYLLGIERLPYQRRVLPMLVVRGLEQISAFRWLEQRLGHAIVYPGTLGFFLFDLAAFTAASIFCVLLYRAASVHRRATLLVFPVFLFCCAWTYVLPPDSNLYYPYDLASVAFFTAGLYFIYTRRFLLLLLTVLVGSLNRETTIFLIPLLALDRLSRLKEPRTVPRLARALPWMQLVLLAFAWVAVKVVLGHQFIHNNPVDEHLRVRENLHFLSPHKWPQLLCACGFLLPVVWFLRGRIPDRRIAAYLLILPLWFLVMFFYGLIGEVRVFGELCSLVAVSATLLLENTLAHNRYAAGTPD